jgi:hypothetical protein
MESAGEGLTGKRAQAYIMKKESKMVRTGALWGLLILGPTTASAAVQPVISFASEAVTVSGLTPGGKVVWFSVAREISERLATIVRREKIAADEDNDGTVLFEIGRKVPFQSIWVAVDLATGTAAVAVPEGNSLRSVPLPAQSMGRGEGAEPDWLQDTRGYVEILLVRPGQGAWGATVGDGGKDDDDGAYDGRLRAALPHLRGVGPSPPAAPERFKAGDVVLVIDPNLMEVSAHQLAEVQP